jgi:hypothetical protein
MLIPPRGACWRAWPLSTRETRQRLRGSRLRSQKKLTVVKTVTNGGYFVSGALEA